MTKSQTNHYTVLNDSLHGRVALVTGGSRGIGNAACLALAAKGASVAVHYHQHTALAHAVVAQVESYGAKAAAFQADLSHPTAPDELVQQVAAYFGRLDILVNNAGIMTRAPITELDDDLWGQTLNLNLNAVFRCIRASVPFMKDQGWGRIINISSQSVYSGSANHTHYTASKAGLLGFTHSLAKELGAFSITVNMIAPGRVITDLLLEFLPGREEEWLQQTPLRRLGRPEEIAAPIAFLASDAAAYITGATLHVNGGLVMS